MLQAIWEYSRAVLSHTVAAGTSTLFALIATFWGLSIGQTLGFGILVAIAVSLFAVANFQAWNEQKMKVEELSVKPDFARVATAFRETWDEANKMWDRGTRGCNNGTDADAWGPEYDSWIQCAKDRITRDAGQNECTAVFEIGSLRGVDIVRGQSEEHTRRLTCLQHHMDQLKAGLKRYLPSERR